MKDVVDNLLRRAIELRVANSKGPLTISREEVWHLVKALADDLMDVKRVQEIMTELHAGRGRFYGFSVKVV